MKRRNFIKTGLIWVPTALVAAPPPIGLRNPAFVATLQRTAAAGGSTPWITSNPATSWRNNFDGCVGALFTTDGTSRTITDLGLYVKSGNTATRVVKIVNGVSLLTSASFDQTGMPEGWNYISVTPVTLAASTSYSIGRTAVNAGAGDNWPDEWTPTTSGITSSLSSAFNVANCDDEANFTGSMANMMFAGVNFKYTTP